MKSTRILPSVLIIATVLQTSNVYALNQEASANVSSVDSTEIARTLQTLKADYMDTIVDTDDFQSMYQQVQNQMASTEQLDLAEYYAQNYEITFPTENLYDLSDVDIASGYDSSATNAQYISLASQCMNTYSDYVDASGQSGNSMQLFQSQFGDVTKELSLSTPTLPEGYDMSHLVTRKVNAITDAASDSWNRLKNNVTAKSEDEIKEALQSNVEANKKDKWGLCGKKSITGFIN